MSDKIQELSARLANAEKAIFALSTVIQDHFPPHIQDSMGTVLNAYFESCESFGFEKRVDFIHAHEVKDHE